MLRTLAPVRRSQHSAAALWRCLTSSPSAGSALPQLPPYDFIVPPYTGPPKEEVLALRRKFLSPAIFHHFKEPVMITDGRMQYLYDERGRRYLDAFAGELAAALTPAPRRSPASAGDNIID